MVAPRAGSVGRYSFYDRIASGGMASVHLGRLHGEAGFGRTVAIKRLHAEHAEDPNFVAMFVDEARVAGRINHPNVVSTLDVVTVGREVFLVMEYVHGGSLANLLELARRRDAFVPLSVAVGILSGMLYGLSAAHEATSETGEPLGLVHRDVSPQNVLVGVDGVARVLDFGVAKATARLQTTREGTVKGKLRYMSPEQARQLPLDRRSDLFSASVLAWEVLTGRRLFDGDDPATIVSAVVSGAVSPPSRVRPDLPAGLDRIVLRGLALDRDDRYATGREMARALEESLRPASSAEIGDWVRHTLGESLVARSRRIAEIESETRHGGPLGVPVIDEVRQRAEAATALIDTPSAGDATQLTELSATRDTFRPRRSSAGRVVAVVAGLVLAGAGGVWLGRARFQSDAPAVVSETKSVATEIPAPSAGPTPVASVTVSIATSAAPVSVKKSVAPRPAVKPNDCNPPYTYDPVRKIRVFKEHCVRK
jgi:eukaryotic-like serine/threonine-protein kinase